MSPVYIHLLVTHMPVFGTILAALVLAYGIAVKNNHAKIAAYAMMIISSGGAVVAYLTGEEAEEAVEHLQGIAKPAIEQHEEFAVIGLVALIILGVLTAAGLLLTIKRPNLSQRVSFVVLFVSLIGFVLIGWTGYLGGKIRHTEIGTTTQQDQRSGKDDD